MTLDNNLLKKIENFKRHVLKSIPLPSTNTPSSDNTNGSTGSSLEYARSDHQHPKSTLYAESVHSHNDILSDLLDDINNTTIVVDSPNPIGQDGDAILLRGRMYGDDVSGKNIDYYISNTLIGSSVTNGNGVSFLDYECDGLGVRNVTAKNGSIVSETLNVTDAMQLNNTTVNSDEWYTGSATRTVESDGVKFEGTGYALFNKKGTTHDYYSHTPDWTSPFRYEMKIINCSGGVNAHLSQDGLSASYNYAITSPCTIVFTVKDGQAKLFIDGVQISSQSYSSDTPLWRVGIQLVNANSSVTIGDSFIYSI